MIVLTLDINDIMTRQLFQCTWCVCYVLISLLNHVLIILLGTYYYIIISMWISILCIILYGIVVSDSPLYGRTR